jgi:hypothetical protein
VADEPDQGAEWLLRGAFGSLQQSAAQNLDTASVWQNLRVTVGTWAYQSQGGGQLPTESELEEAGRQILSAQGVGAAQVSQMRGTAGAWLAAKQKLGALDEGEQVQASEIFTPPWAATEQTGVDPRYRVRVAWQITPEVGEAFTKWSSYELTDPLTSIEDVLAQAGAKAAGDRYIFLLSGGAPPEVGDYEIEQI